MTKKQAIHIIVNCAQKYKKYLDGTQVVFVYCDGNNVSHK